MEWSRGAQAVFQNCSLKVEHASRAVLNSTKYAGRIKGLIRPPSKKKKGNWKCWKPDEGQNMSGASQQYSDTVFSWATQVDGDLFSW